MKNAQSNKQRLWDYGQALGARADPSALKETLSRYFAEDAPLHVAHPINTMQGVDAVASDFWKPFLASFRNLHKCPYIFMAGQSEGEDWVSATGDFVATFASDWLGIPATHSAVHLRYGEFYRIENQKVAEGYLMLDIPDLARQAGKPLFPPSQGLEFWIPGPLAGDGVMWETQDETETNATFDLVQGMLTGLDSYDEADKESMGMPRYWHVGEMRWYASSGIGSNFGLREFEINHQLPWLHAFPDRKGDGIRVAFAEGSYAGYAGWPITHATHKGEYLGAPATNKSVSMRGLDWWKRSGDKLLENWVFVDMLDLFAQFGRDMLAEGVGGTARKTN